MKKLSTHARLMLFLCSISFLMLIAYRVPDLTAWQAQARVPAADTPLQILIPLYSYPNWYAPESYIWDDIAAANSQVPITAIINPSNGPGGEPNDDYDRGLSDLRNAGVTMVGYVSTDYRRRELSDIKADVDLYDQHFNIDGIFFDEVASSADELSDYQELYDYVKARPNLEQVIINPGNQTNEGYISAPASDVAVIFEGNSTQWPDYEPDAYVTNYPANRFAMLVHGTSQATMQSHIDRAIKCNIGYVYLTDDTFENNPWDTLPSFWSEEVAYIQQINGGLKSGATCTSTTPPTPTSTATPSATPAASATPSTIPENALYLPLVIR